MSFSENVKRYRQAAGLTQEAVASAVGVSAQAVSKWEISDSLPDPALLPGLADALNCTVDELFDHRSASPEPLYRTVARWIRDGEKRNRTRRIFDLLNTAVQAATEYFPVEKTRPLVNEKGYLGPQNDADGEIGASKMMWADDSGACAVHTSALLPFAAVSPEPEDGLAPILKDNPKVFDLFRVLGDPDGYRIVMYLLSADDLHPMEDKVLLRKAGADASRCEELMEMFGKTNLLRSSRVEIDGRERRIVRFGSVYAPAQLRYLLSAAYTSAVWTRGNRTSGSAVSEIRPMFR